jgi:hypothetical protein
MTELFSLYHFYKATQYVNWAIEREDEESASELKLRGQYGIKIDD